MNLRQALSAIRKGRVTSIDLRDMAIDDEGVGKLLQALESDSRVTSLNLGSNRITSEGAQKIADWLCSNHSLTELYLQKNQIGDEGAASLARALVINSTLRELHLDNNQVRMGAAAQFAQMLNINSTLSTLNFSDNALTANDLTSLMQVLQTNRSLTTMNLSRNPIGNDGAAQIAQVLVTNKTLRTFNISHSDIGDEGAEHLAKALVINASLVDIQLLGNPIGRTGAISLTNAVQSNTTLTHLNFRKQHQQDSTKLGGYLVRNQLLSSLRALHAHLVFSVMHQTGEPDQVWQCPDLLKQPRHFNAPWLNQVLLDVGQTISDLPLQRFKLSSKVIRDFRNQWLRLVVTFHQRCIDTECDVSTPQQPHAFIQSALAALTQMDVETTHYAKACEVLGDYFYHRYATAIHLEERPAYRQSALRLFFQAGDSRHEMALKLVDQSEAFPEKKGEERKKIAAALALTVPDSLPEFVKTDFSLVSVVNSLNSTTAAVTVTAHKYQLSALIDALCPSKPSSSSFSSTFFAPSVKSACDALYNFLHHEGAPKPSRVQMSILSDQPTLVHFFENGRANLLAGGSVTSIQSFVEAYADEAVTAQESANP